MITLEFDPFGLVLEVVRDLYPETSATVCWREGLRENEGAWGRTEFTDEEPPIVSMDVTTPVIGAVEVLAHELAHVIAGKDADHGEAWEAVFEAIHDEYSRRVAEAA